MITVTDIIPTIADKDASALAVDRAEALFGQDNLRSSACFAASVHERVVDYLEQAPVLAVAIAHGGGLLNGGNRNKSYAAHKLTALCERGARLKEVMRAYGLPTPLRAIKAEALAAYHISAILGLATLNPSTIAQAIPKSKTAQRRWLSAICAWRDRLVLCRRSPDMLMHWASLEIARNRVDHSRAEDLADFAARSDIPLNPAWDWNRAEAAATDWHDRITAGGAEAKFGVIAHQVVCFAPHPDHDVVDGFEFVALRTPAAVYAEGQAMRHCVGSYVADVVSGQSAIISVRHDERRVATLELRGNRVAQLKARFNGTPSVAVQRATKSYHQKLRVAAANRSKSA